MIDGMEKVAYKQLFAMFRQSKIANHSKIDFVFQLDVMFRNGHSRVLKPSKRLSAKILDNSLEFKVVKNLKFFFFFHFFSNFWIVEFLEGRSRPNLVLTKFKRFWVPQFLDCGQSSYRFQMLSFEVG